MDQGPSPTPFQRIQEHTHLIAPFPNCLPVTASKRGYAAGFTGSSPAFWRMATNEQTGQID